MPTATRKGTAGAIHAPSSPRPSDKKSDTISRRRGMWTWNGSASTRRSPGTGDRRFAKPTKSGDEPVQNCLLHVQAVFRLDENRRRVGLESFLVNLLAAIGRQAVHDQSV